jgi:ABC-type antimicrobial peptide transport system permease subunit
VINQVPATYYVPFSQESSGEASYAVRTSGEPTALVASIRAAIRSIDGNLPLANIRTQDEQVAKLFGSERLFARFSSFFGVLALVLVCVGLYGLMSYAVTRRTGEIGLRVALGALPRAVLWMILRESLTLVVVGAAVGVGIAAGMTRLVAKMLYGIAPIDPLTFGSVTLLLLSAAVLAAWLPARRAAKIDPVDALRSE